MNKRITLGIFLTLAASVYTEAKPNVVFLLSDDQAWGDYGFMGHPHVATPNLDRLAEAGLLYERGYVTAPLCRPSLASLATGLYPHQTGIRGNDPVINGAKVKKNSPKFFALRQRMTAPMAEQPSFIQELKKHGYATLQTGKWWEGDPLDHGFTEAMTHGDPTRGGRHGDDGLIIGRETMQPIYDFIEAATHNKQPFFVWYGVYLPHFPHNAPTRLYDKYKDVAPNKSTAWYWANIEWLDETCGQLIDYLKAKDLYENTLFVYTCDNGWVPDPKKRNRFIRSKREPVEAGIRTPIFLTQEGTIAPRRETEVLASNIDIAPTILKACGIEPPQLMSGMDLRNSSALEDRNRIFVDIYEHDSDLDQLDDIDDGLTARVVIQGWDKLIAKPEVNELYNLKVDPDDRNDLALNKPKRVQALSELIDTWLKATPANF